MLIVAFVCFFLLVAAWLFASNGEPTAQAPMPATVALDDPTVSAIS